MCDGCTTHTTQEMVRMVRELSKEILEKNIEECLDALQKIGAVCGCMQDMYSCPQCPFTDYTDEGEDYCALDRGKDEIQGMLDYNKERMRELDA